MKIEALHEFHNEQFAEEWSNKFSPTKDRINLFQLILDNIDIHKEQTKQVLELGIGPGYLAEYILKRRNDIVYEGLDFSRPMLNIASKRLESNKNEKRYTQVDLTDSSWKNRIKTNPGTIISTWALHDLLSKENIFNVYRVAYEVLPNQGKLINGDFIKPEESKIEYEKGRIKPSEHIELLFKAGFADAQCIRKFEENVENPTTSNNYACFIAIK
ncbi:MAG: class I SAM-dependent methyltransferase [Bacteroidota bacterium]